MLNVEVKRAETGRYSESPAYLLSGLGLHAQSHQLGSLVLHLAHARLVFSRVHQRELQREDDSERRALGGSWNVIRVLFLAEMQERVAGDFEGVDADSERGHLRRGE